MVHPIVACARGWLGTRFHHQGRLRKTESHKGGVDCLGLLAGVAAELHLLAPDGSALAACDDTRYSHQPDTKLLQKKLAALLQVIATDEIAPGDMLLLRIDDSPQHLAIVSDYASAVKQSPHPNPLPEGEGTLGIIHAYAQARGVVEHPLDDWWKARIEKAFRIYS